MSELSEGMQAPAFTLPRDGGGDVSLSEFGGKKVVLYFYPKDDTSGCTTEAIAFTALKQDFADADTVVIGMSPDPVKKHDKFRDKHSLDVILAADEDKSTLEAYGVWQEKSMYGKKYMGVERTTLLIDRDGKIARIWPKVKVPGHAEEVLAAAKDL
ncbi:peroxiredoxin [Georhizobium profundi]|jgi:thioredoxin-dependent peroxiredoxin|uniref:thioredoxin-dependent peroxiredoxin n=1 Tax=Georhizobium profundi TaxID=2341112 RepID=A0A3S9B4L8_9HYPH|nr:peroxiredoxin [Georhizobium profundi]AZN71886.1 peroxiredoxin [Georhizobium profundi]GLQ37916.1 peroxiredoxin [Rhizobium albus]